MTSMLQWMLTETIVLTEDITPAEQAHDLGLVHAGWGYWKNPQGLIVARTIGNKLVQLPPDEFIDAIPDTGETEDTYSQEIKSIATLSLAKLAKALTSICNISPIYLSEFIPFIKFSIVDGKVPDLSSLDNFFNPDELEEISQVLSFLANHKNSVTKSIAIEVKQQLQHDTEIEALHTKAKSDLANIIIPEEPAEENATEIIEKGKNGQVDIGYAIQLMNGKGSLLHNPKFIALMHELDDADNGPAVNYISQKLKKAGLINGDQWKKLHKYLKSIKDIAQGPKVPGKIKNKNLQALNKKAEEDMETYFQSTPDQVSAASAWFNSLPQEEKNALQDIWDKFKSYSGLAAKDVGGMVGQAQLLSAAKASLQLGDDSALVMLSDKYGAIVIDPMVQSINSYALNNPDNIFASKEEPTTTPTTVPPVPTNPDLNSSDKGIENSSIGLKNIISKIRDTIFSDYWEEHNEDLILLDNELILLNNNIKSAILSDSWENDGKEFMSELGKFSWMPEDYLETLANIVYPYWKEIHPDNDEIGMYDNPKDTVDASPIDKAVAIDMLSKIYKKHGIKINLDSEEDKNMTTEYLDKINAALNGGPKEYQDLYNHIVNHGLDTTGHDVLFAVKNAPKGQTPLTNPPVTEPIDKSAPVYKQALDLLGNVLANGPTFDSADAEDFQDLTQSLAQFMKNPSQENTDNLHYVAQETLTNIGVDELMLQIGQYSNMIDDLEIALGDSGVDFNSLKDTHPEMASELVKAYKAALDGDLGTMNSISVKWHFNHSIMSFLNNTFDKTDIQKPIDATPDDFADFTSPQIHSELKDLLKQTGIDGVDNLAKYSPDVFNAMALAYEAAKNGDFDTMSSLAQKWKFSDKVNKVLSDTYEEAHGSEPIDMSAIVDSLTIQPSIEKAVNTSMQGWAKGNAEQIVTWLNNKYKDPKNHLKKKNFQKMAIALVKNYDYPIDQVPDELLPDEIKDQIIKAKEAQNKKDMSVPIIPTATTQTDDNIDPHNSYYDINKKLATYTLSKNAIKQANSWVTTYDGNLEETTGDIIGVFNDFKAAHALEQMNNIKDVVAVLIKNYDVPVQNFPKEMYPDAVAKNMSQSAASTPSSTIDDKIKNYQMDPKSIPSANGWINAASSDFNKVATEFNANGLKSKEAGYDIQGYKKTAGVLIKKFGMPISLFSPELIPDELIDTDWVDALLTPSTTFEDKLKNYDPGEGAKYADNWVAGKKQQGGGLDSAITSIIDHWHPNDDATYKNKWHPNLKLAVGGLIKNYGVSPDTFPPDMLPDGLKDGYVSLPIDPKIQKYKVDPSDEDIAKQWVNNYADDDHYSLISHLIDYSDHSNGDESYVNLVGALIKNHGYNINEFPENLVPYALKQDSTETSLSPTPSTSSDPTTELDASSIVDSTLSSFGEKALPADVDALLQATKTAIEATTEFGVVHAFLKLKKNKIFSNDMLDTIKYQIISSKEEAGTLDSTPGSFKKFFNYDEMLDNMQMGEFSDKGGMTSSSQSQKDGFKNWLSQLSPDDRDKLAAAMKVGLNMTTQPEAQKYYQEHLSSIPGWTDDIATVWRRALRGFHDDFKEAEQFEQQSKIEKQKKIKEQEELKKAQTELQKAMDAITSGDSAGTIKAIATAGGIASLPPSGQKEMLVAISKALNAPNSQEMLDQINNTKGYNQYSSHNNLPDSDAKFDTLRKLVAATFFEKHHPYNPTNEPKTTESPTVRAGRVFYNWIKKDAMGTGIVPQGNKERSFLINAVQAALSEPNPQQSMTTLHSILATNTSLSDEQIGSLRNWVQQERQSPGSLNNEPLPTYFNPHSGGTKGSVYNPNKPIPVAPTANLPAKSIANDPNWQKKSEYHKVPDATKQQIHDAVFDALSNGNTFVGNKYMRDMFVNNLKDTLKSHGMDSQQARLLSLWTAREIEKETPLAKKAQSIAQAYYSSQGIAMPPGNIPIPSPQEDSKARTHVLGLSNSQLNYAAKTEFVKGEMLKISSGNHIQWNTPDNTCPSYSTLVNTAQDWRQQHLSPTDLNHFKQAEDSWVGSGQWSKNRWHRKAVNHIATKAIEGPPPEYTHIPTYIERGMALTLEDFTEFIKPIEIGKKIYLGPSGFSLNSSTAKSFGGMSYDMSGKSSGTVHVLLRVRPNKAGQMKAAILKSFNSEQEVIYGTGKHSRVMAVTKHITDGNKVTYEIELQFDESLDESSNILGNNHGLQTHLWDGMSRGEIKMFIKYLNTPLRAIPKVVN